MECPQCHTPLREGELVCPKCGHKLFTVPATKALDNSGDVLVLPPVGETRLLDTMHLRFVFGADQYLDVPFPPHQDELILGRSHEKLESKPDVDLAPYGAEEFGVSRIHAKLTRLNGRLMITDMGSRNGSLLNGKLLNSGDPVVVPDGASLLLGHLPVAVYFWR